MLGDVDRVVVGNLVDSCNDSLQTFIDWREAIRIMCDDKSC